MDCKDVRDQLIAYQRGELPAEERARIASHLEGCESCRRALAAEGELDHALARLPRHAAPIALRRSLAARFAEVQAPPVPPKRMRWWRRAAPSVVSACAAAALVLVGMRVLNPVTPPSPATALVNEGVNDHLRVVYSEHPVEIESGGIHQVKPWFTGRLDFAPRVAFSGDEEFPLVGGSVGYFHDRKAAVFIFKHKLHTISLIVFREEGLAWSTKKLVPVGRLSADIQSDRGFSVILWRDGGLGYCLVSDLNRDDLSKLAVRVAGDAP